MKLFLGIDLAFDHSRQHFFYTETSQLIFSPIQLSGFFIIGKLSLYGSREKK